MASGEPVRTDSPEQEAEKRRDACKIDPELFSITESGPEEKPEKSEPEWTWDGTRWHHHTVPETAQQRAFREWCKGKDASRERLSPNLVSGTPAVVGTATHAVYDNDFQFALFNGEQAAAGLLNRYPYGPIPIVQKAGKRAPQAVDRLISEPVLPPMVGPDLVDAFIDLTNAPLSPTCFLGESWQFDELIARIEVLPASLRNSSSQDFLSNAALMLDSVLHLCCPALHGDDVYSFWSSLQLSAWLYGLARTGLSQKPELNDRLLQTVLLWIARYTAKFRPLPPAQTETIEQRSARRKAQLDPLFARAGIRSAEQWAAKAVGNIDRNTARDYMSGKTQKLRTGSRAPLAAALGITETDLPEYPPRNSPKLPLFLPSPGPSRRFTTVVHEVIKGTSHHASPVAE